MHSFWVHGYAGEVEHVRALSPRMAARLVDFAVAIVKTARGRALTADLWA